jgi:hypothetical protein
MGLDNGVVLKTKLKHNIPNFFDWRNNHEELDVCYWRKFWGFRNEVVREFGQKEPCEDIPLDDIGVGKLRCILEQYLDREYYESEGDSIWDYEDYLSHNIECIENLKRLQKFLEEHPGEECYFYDSY